MRFQSPKIDLRLQVQDASCLPAVDVARQLDEVALRFRAEARFEPSMSRSPYLDQPDPSFLWASLSKTLYGLRRSSHILRPCYI